MKVLKLAVVALFILVVPNLSWSLDPCDRDTKYVPIQERYKKGLLFRIRKCNFTPSFLLGTMHSDDPRVIDAAKDAFDVLGFSDNANFEVVQDADTAKTVNAAMFYPAGSLDNLQSVVGLDIYYKIRTAMALVQPNISEMNYAKMKPWAVNVILNFPKPVADGVVLDEKLQEFAKEKKIPLNGIETAQEQMDIFADMIKEEQIKLLDVTLNNIDEVAKQQTEMTNFYVAKDLYQLQGLADKAMWMIEDNKLSAKLMEKLIYSRNKIMVERTQKLLEKGNAFIAVGALHLTGDKGILALLEKQGYQIEVMDGEDKY